MENIKLSLSIPYMRRLENLRLVFEALASQTMDSSEFEIIVGAMEYCEDYVRLCREFSSRIDIVSVMTSRPFEIPQARNQAMKQASGEICVQMDADSLLSPEALENLYNLHFAFGQNQCVVGQVVGYANNNNGDVGPVETRPYGYYLSKLDELARSKGNPRDPRFQVNHIIPWAFSWTGLIALPVESIRRHNLYFDEDFRGWGVDDLEWGYRISANNIPIVLSEDVRAIHLPHSRDSNENSKAETKNYRHFLRKWPGPDVELAAAFGDIDANALFLDFTCELKRIAGGQTHTLGTVLGSVREKVVLISGVLLDSQRKVFREETLKIFDDDLSQIEVLPLVGLALPFEDKVIDECHVLPIVSLFSEKYWAVICAEMKRVGKQVYFSKRGGND